MKKSSPSKGTPKRGAASASAKGDRGSDFAVDSYRTIVFPNNIRQWRKLAGFPKLLALAASLPQIPYIRLSKIERGEVVAKGSELLAIGGALGVDPQQLLIDIDADGFDIAAWAAGLQDWVDPDPQEDRFAVLLAAALRERRDSDRSLSIAAIERDYGIPPVILSRLENAYKPLDRWNAETMRALCRLFDVAGPAALRSHLLARHRGGALAPFLDLVASPERRIAKTRSKVAALRKELAAAGQATGDPAERRPATPPPPGAPRSDRDSGEAGAAPAVPGALEHTAIVRLVPVFGTPRPDGLIARTPTGEVIEAPRMAGPNAYGLRVCRPTLGPGLPARATVVVDPDRFPSSGGLAVFREAEGLRLLMISFSRLGGMMGYSQHPDREVPLDMVDPADLAAVVSAVYE